MPSEPARGTRAELMAEGARIMTICNACRYCEGYCPVFPAMERRTIFTPADLDQLANLCHNCGECYYACPYTPPHDYALNVPRTLAQIRLSSYEHYAWPAPLARAYRRNGVVVSVALALALSVALVAASSLDTAGTGITFFQVIPHSAMVAVFTSVSLFVVAAMGVGLIRFWRAAPMPAGGFVTAVKEALALTHLHGGSAGCTDALERRPVWRRWFHHATFYGFALCFAATSVAAFYHYALGWYAPYGYFSLPVILGTVGGVGLLIGPVGLYLVRQRQDRELRDAAQDGMDTGFVALLFLTSLTGLLLLALRETTAMPTLLAVHLAVVLALFALMPYGKFVHGFYRVLALVRDVGERKRPI